jgi:hypothetical protein
MSITALLLQEPVSFSGMCEVETPWKREELTRRSAA